MTGLLKVMRPWLEGRRLPPPPSRELVLLLLYLEDDTCVVMADFINTLSAFLVSSLRQYAYVSIYVFLAGVYDFIYA